MSADITASDAVTETADPFAAAAGKLEPVAWTPTRTQKIIGGALAVFVAVGSYIGWGKYEVYSRNAKIDARNAEKAKYFEACIKASVDIGGVGAPLNLFVLQHHPKAEDGNYYITLAQGWASHDTLLMRDHTKKLNTDPMVHLFTVRYDRTGGQKVNYELIKGPLLPVGGEPFLHRDARKHIEHCTR
jgi:hypothetical protein